MSSTLSTPALLIALSALGYALATLAMKTMADAPSVTPVFLIAGFFIAAIVLEILVLQRLNFAYTYVAILAAEALFVLVISYLIGETLSTRETIGGIIVLLGAGILSA